MRKPRRRKTIRKETVYIKKTRMIDTITNIPLNPQTGHMMFHKMEIEKHRKIHKGTHTLWTVFLKRDNGQYYIRKVLE